MSLPTCTNWTCSACTFDNKSVDDGTGLACHVCRTPYDGAVAAPVDVVDAPVAPESLSDDNKWDCSYCSFTNKTSDGVIKYVCHVCQKPIHKAAVDSIKDFVDTTIANEAAEVEAALAAVKAFKGK